MPGTTRGWLLTFCCAALLTGCGQCGEEPTSGGDAGTREAARLADAGFIPVEEEAEFEPAPLSPRAIAPRITPVGPDGVTPNVLVINFARNLITDESKLAGPDTVLEIEPEVGGTLKFTTPSTLQFKPTEGFRPGTTYDVTLKSVESRDGVLNASDGEWSKSFTTPEFAFIGLSDAVYDPQNRRAEVDVRFSAAVKPKKMEKYALWWADGVRVRNITYAKGASENVIHAFFDTPRVKGASKLRVTVEEEFPFRWDEEIRAKAGEASVGLLSGPKVEIFDVVRREGPAGFFLEVVCRDHAAPGGRQYYWHRELRRSYYVSQRCLPSETSIEKAIEFNPPVDVEVSSSRGGFNIVGDFERGTYELRFHAGMRTKDEGILRKSYTETISIPSRSPTLQFVDKGRYIPRSGWDSLTLRHRNLDEIDVEIRHVPKDNVVFWMSGDDEKMGPRTSNVVARVRMPIEGPPDEATTSPLDVGAVVPNPEPGVYAVRVRGEDASDTTRLMVTDMNLIVKTSAPAPEGEWSEDAFVWAVDMETAKPISGSEIDVIRKSGKVMASCETGAKGGCELDIPPRSIDSSGPFAIIARHDDDFTYLKYDELQVRAPDAATHGEPYESKAAYRAAIYGDRDVYRPAETAHLVAVLRDENYVAPTAGLPVEMVIEDPRRKVLRKKVVHTNAAGVLTHDETFGDFAPTGGYTMILSVGKREVARHRFNVEEFVPERMTVEAETASDDYLTTQEIPVSVEAEYLFGGSAEGSDVEVTCRLVPGDFEPEKNREYSYGPVAKASNPIDLGVVSRVLDANGETTATCPGLETAGAFTRPAKVDATVSVFEAGSGRSTVAHASAAMHPETYYVGLKSGTKEVKKGEPFTVEGILVDWNGEPVKDAEQVEVEYVRLEREYYWRYDPSTGDQGYGKYVRPVTESTSTLDVKDGEFEVRATPRKDARGYVVRVSYGNSTTELRFDGEQPHWWWWGNRGDTTEQTPRPSRPTSLKIEAPEQIDVQKPATFQIDVPFEGRMLVTAETDHVLTHEWHDVEPGKLEWKFALAEFQPNVYVSALLIKDPHADSKEAFMPDRAFGVQSVKVKPSGKLHEVKIEAPEKVRPHSTLEVTIDVGESDGKTYATVAAVDEGILSLTNFETPDPADQLFARRALGVKSYETVGWAVQSKPAGPSSRTGGGGNVTLDNDEGLGRPMPVKPVALWSDLVEIPKSGKKTVRFDVPRYRGALRIMAVTAGKERTGSAETRVVVRDPLVLQTTLPRFLSAEDQVQIPVFVTNMTGKEQTVDVELDATMQQAVGMARFEDPSSSIRVDGDPKRSVHLKPEESGTVVFGATALREAGVAKFRVTATAGDLVSYDEAIVPFRPSGPRERTVERVKLKEGENGLARYLTGWVPTSERSTIWVTNVPYGQAFDHLKYLIRYPFGCIEQTTSTTRPLLYISELIQLIDPATIAHNGSIDKMVRHGLDRALSMQGPSGGFGYWPGNDDPWPWATAYATHMLLDARERGYDVPDARIEAALDYMESSLDAAREDRYGYREAKPYMLYVLARAERPKKAFIQRLIDQLPDTLEGRDKEKAYMLKAALYMAGDRRYAADLKSPDTTPIKEDREARWTYYSDLRRRGFMLSTFHDAFGVEEAGEELATLVGKGLEKYDSRRYTTQELMWGITGLGKWIAGRRATFDTPTLYANGREVEPAASAKGRSDRTWSINRASEYRSLYVDVPKVEGDVWAIISSEGVRKFATPEIAGEGLMLTRGYYDHEGNEIEPTGHELGDLVYVKMEVRNTSGKDLHNLALVDRFPAGFEVENPRLGRGTLPDWVDPNRRWRVDHMNIRDDRMELFGTIKRGQTVEVTYAVRAIAGGEFLAPPPEIEAMYEPEIWARSAPARVTVMGPWDELMP